MTSKKGKGTTTDNKPINLEYVGDCSLYEENKYFKAFILPFYMISREKTLYQAMQELSDGKLWKEVADQLVQYLADMDVTINAKEESHVSHLNIEAMLKQQPNKDLFNTQILQQHSKEEEESDSSTSGKNQEE